MKRRTFIQSSLVAPAAIMTAESYLPVKTNLQLKIMNTDWGFSGTVEEFSKKTKDAGYDGIEVWWPGHEKFKTLAAVLQKYQLEIGFLCGGHSAEYSKHTTEFKDAVEAASSGISQKPLYINCHSGKDFFTFDQNATLIAFTQEKEAKTGIEIFHETHRGRMCYSAPVTKLFLDHYKKMKLTLDISHWTNVHESMLDNQKDTINQALNHSHHIHARIGHEQGPQVNDPRAPEWKEHVEKHLLWWDKVVENREKSGYKHISFTTEFGPPNYLQALPYTRQAVANQWDINIYIKNLIKNRYSL